MDLLKRLDIFTFSAIESDMFAHLDFFKSIFPSENIFKIFDFLHINNVLQFFPAPVIALFPTLQFPPNPFFPERLLPPLTPPHPTPTMSCCTFRMDGELSLEQGPLTSSCITNYGGFGFFCHLFVDFSICVLYGS